MSIRSPQAYLRGPQPSDSGPQRDGVLQTTCTNHSIEHYNGQTQLVAELDRSKPCYANRTEEEQRIPATCTDRLLASLVHSLSLSKCHVQQLLCFRCGRLPSRISFL